MNLKIAKVYLTYIQQRFILAHSLSFQFMVGGPIAFGPVKRQYVLL
jgi:hypothetical protein